MLVLVVNAQERGEPRDGGTGHGADPALCARMNETVSTPEITEEGETG